MPGMSELVQLIREMLPAMFFIPLITFCLACICIVLIWRSWRKDL